MKHVDEFRDAALARRLVEEIRRRASRRWVLMEVCGGQTHGLLRHGIDDALADVVELIHGPGCPVCVTPAEDIDFACELTQRPEVILTSFGDMLRVPGNGGSLLDMKSRGGDVRLVYSPLDAVQLARREPDRQIVFFAVGFETTAPASALAVMQAERLGLSNFSLLVSHVRVLPAMRLLMQSAENHVQGFLAAGHVCTVTGFAEYDDFVREFRVPVAVAGFEPVDLLLGIRECVEQLEEARSEVVNSYGRSVRREGNRDAQRLIQDVYRAADGPWRGLGTIPCGVLRLRDRLRLFDARQRFPIGDQRFDGCLTDCRAGDVLIGRIKPRECPHFGTACTPETPLGAPMVSSEGACAAYFRYGPRGPAMTEQSHASHERPGH
jgi:hydrogenase expression/formation protein HypD